jgi:hypothetical protein
MPYLLKFNQETVVEITAFLRLDVLVVHLQTSAENSE